MKLIPSSHFKNRIAARGVSWQECEDTLAAPDRKRIKGKGAHGGVKTIFEKDFYDNQGKPKKTVVVLVGEKLPKSDNIIGISAWKKE